MDPLAAAGMLAAAAANATAVRTTAVAAKNQRAAEAELDDASTVALRACDAPAGMIVPVLKAPSNTTRPNPSNSGEVSPCWLFFVKLPVSTDEDGSEVSQVECQVERVLANGDKRKCGAILNHKSKDGTGNLMT